MEPILTGARAGVAVAGAGVGAVEGRAANESEGRQNLSP